MVFYSPKGVKGSKKEQKGAKGSKKDLSSLLDSVILYVVSLGEAPSSFFFASPVAIIVAGLFLCLPAFIQDDAKTSACDPAW